ncbi:MAG TPA: FtsX-like permease family protein [Bacilli bacterium]
MGRTLFRFLFRKMWNTRWMTGTTLVGLIFAVAFTLSIPMYADGALKRVVAKSLQEKNDGFPAGSILMRYQAVGSQKADLDSLATVRNYIQNEIPKQIGFPYFAYTEMLSIRGAQISPVDPNKVDPSKRRQMNMITMGDLESHVDITNGRMYSDAGADGIIEAVVYEEAMYRNDFTVGDEFKYPVQGGAKPLTVKVVGSFKPKQEGDPYWYQGFNPLVNALIVNDKVFTEQLLKQKKIPLTIANWYYAFDLREIRTSQLTPLSNTLSRLDIDLYQMLKNTKVDFSFSPMLDEFKRQSVQLQMLLFTLAAPMIAMVFYFIVMNSRQSLERQKSDIAVLRSRGASTRQIIWIFLLEGFILGGVSLVIGPLVGWFMAKSIGSSSGFLTFVDRKAIPVDVSAGTFVYALAAVLIAILAAVIPAIRYARSTIVGLKQQMARLDRKPLWQRWFLDVALLCVAGYGWYLFYERQMLSFATGLSNDQLQLDPLLFFVPALTIFAIGLCFLRIFPWILRLVNRLGGKFLPVPLYLTLTQLSRSSKAYFPLMLLLILTLGLGVYDSSAARTIDLNSTERTLYKYGTDVIVQTVWEGVSDALPQDPGNAGGGQNGGNESGQDGGQNGGGQNGGAPGFPGPDVSFDTNIRYVEPPFEIFRHLPGVEAAARVLRTKGNVVVSGRSVGMGAVMGIDNVDFAKVAWFRNDLFPYSPRQYLNLLGAYDELNGAAALVSADFAEKYRLKPGDLFTISLQQQAVEFVVVGTVPYWPTEYPQQMPFFIVNLDYIYDQVPLMPYEVWLKMKDGAMLTPAVQELQEHDITISAIENVKNELLTQRKHPARGGVFGILSLGFLVSVAISFIGYLLYWFFNLSSRVVQFGVLRAMGLSRKQLTGMLLLEQVFTAGLSIVLGFAIGRLASYLYLPFLQTTEDSQMQVPPFRVVFDFKDSLQIGIVVMIMLIAGATLLLMHIRRLRVHQAVKLGEER